MPDQQAENEALQQHLDAITKMRMHGYSQDEINQFYAGQVNTFRQHGYSEDEIRSYYGGTDPAPMQQEIQQTVQANQQTGGHTNWLDLFAQGLTNSSGAALLGVKPHPYQGQGGVAGAVTSALGETLGDLPVAIPSAFWQGKATGAVVARIPGAAEFAPAAAGLTGAFQAGAVPTLIKSARDQWIRAGNSGWNAGDFLQAHGLNAQAAIDAGKVGLASTAAAGVGGIAERTLAAAGVRGGLATGARLTAEGGTFTAANAAIQQKMPTAQDFVEGTLILFAAHGATGGLNASSAAIRAARGRLQQYYVDTGTLPQDAASAAQHDPVLQRQLAGLPNPPARPGSSRSPTGPMNPALNPEGKPDPDQFVIPRIPGSFDHAVDFTFKHEGGAEVIDTNKAKVRWGINAADNPGVDIDHLTRDQAAEIYKHKYWDAIQADSLPENMRAAAFDTAVVEGVGKAKQWLSESGGDPQVFLAKRSAFEAKLAREDPAKYGRFAEVWAKRVRDLGGSGPAVDLLARDPSNPLAEHEKALLDNDGQPPEPPGGGGEEPPEGPRVPPPGSSEDALDHVMGHTNEDDVPKGGWLSDTLDATKALYQELFRPEHPINRLVNAVMHGDPIDGIDNPAIMRRLAERSQDDAKYTINGDGHGNDGHMTDLDGNIVGRSLKTIIESAGDDAAQKRFLRGYSVARWADMMHSEGKETGLDPDKVKQVIADHAHFEPLFQELVGWRNHTLGWLKDGGVISQKLHDELIADKNAAVPGYRQMDDGTWKPATSMRKGNPFNPIKASTGSERQVLPIEQSLMREAFLRRQLAANNRSNSVLADFAEKAGVAGSKRAVDYNVVKALSQLGHIDAEHDIDGMSDMMAQLAKSAGAAVPQDQMPVLRDGKMYAVKFNDEYKDIVPVVRGFDKVGQSMFFKIAAKISAIPRTLQTVANPAFAPHILGLDTTFQYLTNPDAKNVIASLSEGFGAATRNPEGYDSWLRHGAEHVFDHMSKDAYFKSVFKGDQQEGPLDGVWNAAQTPWHWLQAWNRMNFGALRAGRYIQGIKAGESPEVAGAASTDSAYHRLGFGGPVAKSINAVMPFFTARLNGMEKSVRSLLGGVPEAVTGGKLQNRTTLGTPYSLKTTAIRSLAILTVPAMISWLTNKDQDWYKAMPEWQKDNAWFVIPPMGGLPPIPMGAPAPILTAFFIGIPRRLGEAFIQHDPHAFDNILPSLGASVAGPVSLPTASFLTPFVEHIANFSFFKNQPLASQDQMNAVGTPEQYNHYSSAFAKGLSRAVGGVGGLSPVVIDNYIRSWGAQYGGLLQQVSNMVGDQFTPDKRPEVKAWELPPFASYVQRYPSASAKPIEDFYTRSHQLDQVHGSIQAAMREGDLGRVQQLARDNPSAAVYHMLRLQSEPSSVNPAPYMGALGAASSQADWNDINLIQQGERAMRQANQYAKGVYDNERLTPQDKRQILDRTYQVMQGMSEQINDAMDRAHISESLPQRALEAIGVHNTHKAPGSITFQEPVPGAGT